MVRPTLDGAKIDRSVAVRWLAGFVRANPRVYVRSLRCAANPSIPGQVPSHHRNGDGFARTNGLPLVNDALLAPIGLDPLPCLSV